MDNGLLNPVLLYKGGYRCIPTHSKTIWNARVVETLFLMVDYRGAFQNRVLSVRAFPNGVWERAERDDA